MPILLPSQYLYILKIRPVINIKNLSRLALGISLGLGGNAYGASIKIDEPLIKNVAEYSIIRAFNIDSGTLDAVLSRFGQQSGVLVSVNGRLSQGKHSQGVQGNYTTEQALSLLLRGTGLELVRQPQGGYIIIAPPDADNDVITLSALQINDSVYNAKLAPYIVDEAPSTTRSNVPILDTPRSIQVIDREFIDDADVQSLEDALQYVSGTSRRQRQGGIDSQYYVRGFKEQDTYRNGKREMSSKSVNMNTIGTVDVLKGPSSVRFGVNAPGGIVNYTTKKPEAEAFRSIKVRLDEYGKKEIISDFTGATNESGSVLYRFIASGENSESFRDFSERKTSTIAPSFTFLLSDNTQLTADYELHQTELPIDRGLPIGQLNNGRYVIADVPVERKFSEPGDHSSDDTQSFDVTLTHQFNDNWQGELSYSYQTWDSSLSDVSSDDFYPEDYTDDDGNFFPAGSVVRENSGYISAEQETHQGSALLHGDFEWAGVQHKMTIGADYDMSDWEGVWGSGVDQPSVDYPSIFNIYDPVYGEIPTGLIREDDETETKDTHGIFISETAYLGESLIVNLASRYDYYDYEYTEVYDDPEDNVFEKAKDEALTWNAGLLYKVMSDASLYLSYATSYEPNSASDDLIGEIKPQEGEQWEVGLKGLAMNESLQYSLVYYDITKSNISNEFEDSDGNEFIRLIGEQTSKGVELDTTWQFTDDFSFLASYSYIDAEISKNEAEPELVGNTPGGVPEHSAALFMSYALTPYVAGLSVMGGINYTDEVPNKVDNKFMIPGATVYDLGLKYRLALSQDDALLIQAGVKNLTDKRVYIHQRKDYIGIGQVRTLYANLEYQF